MATQTNTEIGTLWQIDPAHTDVGFAVRHMMVSTVKGHFADVSGTVDTSDPANPKVNVTIKAASIETRQPPRDDHLRSADFLDVKEYPTITFRSTRVDGDPTGDEFKLIGDITIRGMTRPITLDVTAEGRGRSPTGDQVAGFTAKARLNRSEFGLKWNKALEAGGVLVGDEVRITVDTELIRQS